MIRSIFLIFVIICSVFAAGCDQTGTTGVNSPAVNANASSNHANMSNSNRLNPAANSNDATLPANLSVPVTPNIPANVATKNAPMPQAQPLTQPGPDDSEIETSLAENLVKTRVFKSNPRLLKIEETTISAENGKKIIKVYLKNGQVKEIQESKIKDPMTASAADILKAIG